MRKHTPAGRAVLRHSVGAAKFWSDRFRPKLRKCPCGSVVYCSTECQTADWKQSHKRNHQKLVADAKTKKVPVKKRPEHKNRRRVQGSRSTRRRRRYLPPHYKGALV
jgi:hypothetical protein